MARLITFLLALAAGIFSCCNVPAQENPALTPVVTVTNGAFSIASPNQLAPWQQRLTLGPSDVLTVGLYERPEFTKSGVTIGPDGRLNYLQARDISAAGLTIDELRDRLQNVLLTYYKPPLRVVVIPQAYNSKKYLMLGNIVQKGIFRLDTPITLLEAIAKAQGFVSAPDGNASPLVDFARSFLMRRDGTNFARLPVNFESLFLQGDLGQNVPIEPDDYVYFPPATLQEVYVLGEVPRPGASPFASGLTVIGAIATHGGFTERAYRRRVLIVRGSLTQPKTYVLDVADVLNAKSLDFKLEPRDIVYISRKPWYKAEELLEAAIFDFMRAAVVTYTGQHVGPFIKEPLFR